MKEYVPFDQDDSMMGRLVAWVPIILLLCAGAFCDEDVNECDLNPCQNGGSCENYAGAYTCHCSQQSQDGLLYGGQNCTVALLGCEGHACQNGAVCLPLLADGEHSHQCACPHGFTGPNCQTSTTFSFEMGGHLLLQSPAAGPEAPWNITLTFRTKMANATVLLRRAGELDVRLELARGRPCLRVLAGGGTGDDLEVPCDVSDGEWHSIEVAFGGRALGVRLLDDSCGGENKRTVVAERGSLKEGSGEVAEIMPTFHTIFIGGVGKERTQTEWAEGPLTPFVGCVQDVWVDSRLVLLADWPNSMPINVTPGCSLRDRCEDRPCQNRGRCVSQWITYQCECYRPYDGPDCSEEYVAARFGRDDQASYATLSVGQASSEALEISLFVRTRSQGALLLALADSSGPYLWLRLEEGRPCAQALGSRTLRAGAGAAIDDGRFHLLGLSIRDERMTLSHSGRVQGAVTVHRFGVQTGDLVHVGGLPDPYASATFGGYLRGCVQDLRMGAHQLQLYPSKGTNVSAYGLQELVNVAHGCAGDDACRSDPCLNGGVCYSMWDDFTCACPPSTTGRRCEEIMWCELSACPSSAVCQPVAHGFECISNAYFHEDSNPVSYRGSGKILRSLTSVSFHIRTRSRNASILHAEKSSEVLAVSVQESHLYLELRSGIRSLGLSVGSQVAVSDGQWHAVTLSMLAPGSQTSRWAMEVDEQGEASISEVAAGNLDFFKEGVELLLGGGGLVGCLSTVEISGLALPHLGDDELRLPRPQEERFVRTSTSSSLLGCWGSPVCDPDPCLNGGHCVDLFHLYRCSCPPSWMGPLCQLGSGPCASGPCVHGNCSAQGLRYACSCEPGYAGPDCASQEEDEEEDEDPCQSHLCAWGATCLRGYATYSCLCPPDRTGQLCNVKFEQLPWYEENYPKPIFPVAVCGGERWNYTCFNGGNCTQIGSRWACKCLPGFTGQWCETDIDECSSEPCVNGGYCINMINGFHCFCKTYFTGDLCEVPISDLHIYIFVLLWQNFFQLLSYVILRMDDEPEIDWWFAED